MKRDKYNRMVGRRKVEHYWRGYNFRRSQVARISRIDFAYCPRWLARFVLTGCDYTRYQKQKIKRALRAN